MGCCFLLFFSRNTEGFDVIMFHSGVCTTFCFALSLLLPDDFPHRDNIKLYCARYYRFAVFLTEQTIACYLDYIDDGGAVLCFTTNDRLIGRGVVSRATGCNIALYASIVMSAGPATVKADWTGILNSTKIVRTQVRRPFIFQLSNLSIGLLEGSGRECF